MLASRRDEGHIAGRWTSVTALYLSSSTALIELHDSLLFLCSSSFFNVLLIVNAYNINTDILIKHNSKVESPCFHPPIVEKSLFFVRLCGDNTRVSGSLEISQVRFGNL